MANPRPRKTSVSRLVGIFQENVRMSTTNKLSEPCTEYHPICFLKEVIQALESYQLDEKIQEIVNKAVERTIHMISYYDIFFACASRLSNFKVESPQQILHQILGDNMDAIKKHLCEIERAFIVCGFANKTNVGDRPVMPSIDMINSGDPSSFWRCTGYQSPYVSSFIFKDRVLPLAEWIGLNDPDDDHHTFFLCEKEHLLYLMSTNPSYFITDNMLLPKL